MNKLAGAALSICFLLSGSSLFAAEASFNVAAGKPVTLVGIFGSPPELAATITDGVFLPKNTVWTEGTVWWDGNLYPDNYVEIDLLGSYLITGLIGQADDNDAYILNYRTSDGVWAFGVDVPNYDFEPFGMQTRPNPYDDSEQYLLPTPTVVTAFRIYGNLNDGDGQFSVSEIQAYGLPIPEPGSGVLVVCAMISWARRIRCSRR